MPPDADPEDFDSDPILEVNELKDRGQIARAKKLLERFEEAEALFMRLLWMSPSDNLSTRFLSPQVRARKPWTADGR